MRWRRRSSGAPLSRGSASQLERAALDAAATEQQLGKVDEHRVVAAFAQLRLETCRAGRDDHVETVAGRVETEHGTVGVGDTDRVGIALGEDRLAALVERVLEVRDVGLLDAAGTL